jgi:outer membrane protein OmpA-like peptidoglycan-associated protein
MKKISLFVFFLCALASSGYTQSSFSVSSLVGVNTSDDDIICAFIDNGLLVANNSEQDVVNDYKWNEHRIFSVAYFEKKNNFRTFEKGKSFLPYQLPIDQGTACFDPIQQVLYFSSAFNFGKAKGSRLKLYQMKRNGNAWHDPELLPFCKEGYDYTHPWFDSKLNLLVFSSNTIGTRGGMDIWLCYFNQGNWTEPTNPGVFVNSAGNELFPVLFEGDIYFSSNKLTTGAGFDLYKSLGDEQYSTSIQLSYPFNTPKDDLRIVWLDRDHAYVASNRDGGMGGDDVYMLSRVFQPQENQDTYSAMLHVNNMPAPGAKIGVTNSLGELMISGTLDDKGTMSLATIPLYQKVRLTVSGIDSKLYGSCVLYLIDAHGNKVRELRLNALGWVELELLPFDYSDLNLMANMDNSVLKIDLEGSVRRRLASNSSSLPLQENNHITIVDEDGQIVAIARLDQSGRFAFSNLNPELSYTFRLSGESKQSELLVLDRGKQILLPFLNEEVVYSRIEKRDAIELVNENNDVVYVAPEDVFIVNRIYYGSNSAELSTEAQEQLDQLADMMMRNKEVAVELTAHTDARGSADNNLLLSQRRAEAIKAYLVSKGIPTAAVLAKGKGESELLNGCRDADGCNDAAHAINRRAEIQLKRKLEQ